MMEKDLRKSNLKLIFQLKKTKQKCEKTTKKEKSEHLRRLLRNRLGSCFQSSEEGQGRVAGHQTRPTFIKLTVFPRELPD